MRRAEVDLLLRRCSLEEGKGWFVGRVETVMRLRILDLKLLVRTETRFGERFVGMGGGGGGGEKESHVGAAVPSLPKPATDIIAAEGMLMLDARTREPSGNCNVSGLGGGDGGAGETGRVAAFLSGRGGAVEGGLVKALAADARRRCSSAKAVEAKGRLFGLSERVKSRRIFGLLGVEMLSTDDGRLMVALKDEIGGAPNEGSVGRDFVEREGWVLAVVEDGGDAIGQALSMFKRRNCQRILDLTLHSNILRFGILVD